MAFYVDFVLAFIFLLHRLEIALLSIWIFFLHFTVDMLWENVAGQRLQGSLDPVRQASV